MHLSDDVNAEAQVGMSTHVTLALLYERIVTQIYYCVKRFAASWYSTVVLNVTYLEELWVFSTFEITLTRSKYFGMVNIWYQQYVLGRGSCVCRGPCPYPYAYLDQTSIRIKYQILYKKKEALLCMCFI